MCIQFVAGNTTTPHSIVVIKQINNIYNCLNYIYTYIPFTPHFTFVHTNALCHRLLRYKYKHSYTYCDCHVTCHLLYYR